MAQINFDASQYAPDGGGFEAIPSGWYSAVISKSELKPTKDGSGSYLQVDFNVIDGPHKDATVIARLNISNPSEKAQKIGCGQLSAICHAVNVMYVQDSSQLHNIPMKIRVKYIEPRGEYEANNDVIGFKNANYVPPTTPASTGSATVPSANPMTNQPWSQPPANVQIPQPAVMPMAQTAMPPQMAPTVPPQAPVYQQPAPIPQQAPVVAPAAPVAPWGQAPAQAGAEMPAWATAPAPAEQPAAPMQQQPVQQQVPMSNLPGQQATPPWQQ